MRSSPAAAIFPVAFLVDGDNLGRTMAEEEPKSRLPILLVILGVLVVVWLIVG
jgi:hypothetical protein